MVVFQNRGTPIQTSKCYSPYDWDCQNGSPNFGKPPSLQRQHGFPQIFPHSLLATSIRAHCSTVRESARAVVQFSQLLRLAGSLAGCQNHGPFLGTLHIRCRTILGSQKEIVTLTTTHIVPIQHVPLFSADP